MWELLSNAATYTDWSDAIVDRVAPEGPAQAGQHVEAHTRILALPVRIDVRGIDPAKRTLDLTTALPFGITVLNHMTVTPVDASSCRVSFG